MTSPTVEAVERVRAMYADALRRASNAKETPGARGAFGVRTQTLALNRAAEIGADADALIAALTALDQAREALRPFAQAAQNAEISGHSPNAFVGAREFEAAAAVVALLEPSE